jgi:cytochrome c-type biogenesis protein CcmE
MQVRHKKLLAGGTLVSLGIAGVLLWTASPEMSYYATPSQVGAGGTAPAALVLTDGTQDLAVELAAELPALLREGQEAVAEGRLANGILQATRVIPRFDDPLKSVQ